MRIFGVIDEYTEQVKSLNNELKDAVAEMVMIKDKEIERLKEENKQLKKEAGHAADLLEDVGCACCPRYTCVGKEYCDILMAVGILKNLTRKETDNDQR